MLQYMAGDNEIKSAQGKGLSIRYYIRGHNRSADLRVMFGQILDREPIHVPDFRRGRNFEFLPQSPDLNTSTMQEGAEIPVFDPSKGSTFGHLRLRLIPGS